MILPDVDVLVHAFRADSTDQEICRPWLENVVNGDARYGMSPQVLSRRSPRRHSPKSL